MGINNIKDHDNFPSSDQTEEKQAVSKAAKKSLTPSQATREQIKITLDLGERNSLMPKKEYSKVESIWDESAMERLGNPTSLGFDDGDTTAYELAARTNLRILKASNSYTPQYYNLSKKAQQAMEQNIWQMEAMANSIDKGSNSVSQNLISNRLLWRRFLKEESVMDLIAEQNQLLAGTTGAQTLIPGGGLSQNSSSVTLYINPMVEEEIFYEQQTILAPMPREEKKRKKKKKSAEDRRKRRGMRNINKML